MVDISELLNQMPNRSDALESMSRESFVFDTVVGDYGNEIAECVRQLTQKGESPNLRIRPPLELYGDGGESSGIFDSVGGALTEKDIEDHPCSTLIQSIAKRVNNINNHLKEKRTKKAQSEAEKLRNFLAAAAWQHPLRRSF